MHRYSAKKHQEGVVTRLRPPKLTHVRRNHAPTSNDGTSAN